jgi:hypothetical protein
MLLLVVTVPKRPRLFDILLRIGPCSLKMNRIGQVESVAHLTLRNDAFVQCGTVHQKGVILHPWLFISHWIAKQREEVVRGRQYKETLTTLSMAGFMVRSDGKLA